MSLGHVITLSVLTLSVVFCHCYAGCRFPRCQYTESHGANKTKKRRFYGSDSLNEEKKSWKKSKGGSFKNFFSSSMAFRERIS
jgi:hypothetical protein